MPNTPPHDPNIDYRAHPELYRVAPQPAEKPLHSVEMDELYTHVHRAEKNRVYIATFVERRSSCVVGWEVCLERAETILQALLDKSPQAVWYYSDLFATYKALRYTPGVHTSMPGKRETYRSKA